MAASHGELYKNGKMGAVVWTTILSLVCVSAFSVCS